ncbi:MAG: NADH-quinone oxidoreductase subunit N [Tepidisphaeraceae bacterium]
MAFFVATFVGSSATPAFGGMIVADPAALLWRQVLLLFTAGVIVIWFAATKSVVHDGDGPEFLTLLLAATMGLSLMGATSNLLMLLLATELASMPCYVLAGFRKTIRPAAEASLKYVLFGSVCTAVTIYGLSLLYGVSGSMDAAVWLKNASTPPPLAIIGLLMVGVGLLFKLAAVPAHFWCPDVFQGSHVDVAAFLSVASKGAGVILIARLWNAAGSAPASSTAALVIALVAVVTMTVGNLGALRQNSVKRLLAYSSIAHAGYLLSGLAVLPGGTPAVLVYLIIYAVMNLGAFAVLAGVEKVSGSDDVTAFDGLASRSPFAAAAMAVCLVSMVGLPPAAGFMAKLKIMTALGHAGAAWWWVVAAVGLNSVVSLAYYAKILRAMYLQPARTRTPIVGWTGPLAITCAALLLLMLIGYAPLEYWAANAVFILP